MNSSKKILLSTIVIAVLIVVLTGITFSFFNYTRTGSSNVIKTGRIYFNSEQGNAINLTNMFPIDTSVTGIMDDATKVGTVTIHVTGDTTYSEGIEYLVSAVNVQNTIGTKKVPISINVSVQNNNESSLGTSDDNYFNNRGTSVQTSIYKVLANDTINEDDRLVVGYIKSGQDGVDGNIVIKAYLDKNKVAITDTYDGTESDTNGTTNDWIDERVVLTTSEWNSLQQDGVSFQVKVEANEGIWVEETETLYGIMRKSAVMDNTSSTFVSASTGIDFKQDASDTNGKGVYMRAGTENSAYPVVYYRGEVEDNNVKFANKCWKAIRSTETGGVKLIYNNDVNSTTTYEHNDVLADTEINYTNDTNYPFVYNSTTKSWTTAQYSGSSSITIYVNETANYSINYDPKISSYSSMRVYVNDNQVLSISSKYAANTYDLGTITPSDEIKVTYTRYIAFEDDGTSFQIEKNYGTSTTIESCEYDVNSVTSIEGRTYRFSKGGSSIAYNGYMYGDVYTKTYAPYDDSIYFGTGFTYDGTKYKLVNPTILTGSNLAYKYSCNLSTPDGECEVMRFYYKAAANYALNTTYNGYYILLTNGDDIIDAISNTQKNDNDSDAKMLIDEWYQTNMTSYTNKLEDTIFCNDRSFYNLGRYDSNSSGAIYYSAYKRVADGMPSLVCPNKNDAFTVSDSSGNQKLTYPVGLLTVDEVLLTSISRGWTMSPASYSSYPNEDDYLSFNYAGKNPNEASSDRNPPQSINPVVSLKPGTPVVSGTGTASDPYVIE